MKRRTQRKGASAPFSYPPIEVSIESLAVGGAGVARHDGMVLFIPDAAPGDRLLVQISKKKKNFAEASILEILEPSPSRRTPPCPVATRCGGCNWQHIDEEEQRRQKQLIVHQAIQRFTKISDYEVLPLVPSPRSLRYRNRIQPKAYKDYFGFFERGSHKIVNVDDCLISEERLTQDFALVREWVKPFATEKLQKLEMYLSHDLSKVQYNLIENEEDTIGFSQVNRFQNLDLISTALEWAKDSDDYEHIYDLYAGSGNFTFPLSQTFTQAKKISAVELNPKLVKKGNSESQDSRIQFHHASVDDFMISAKIQHQDFVLLDPPRAGCSELVMKKLAQNPPRKIIYISCHPVALARDLKWLLDESQLQGTGLKLVRVQAFEMFPQTDHVETIAELRVDS